MSLKSFDKFCEKLILTEPGSEKEIYDERQNQLRSKLTVEAFTVYGALSLFAAAFCDWYAWSESVLSVLAMCGALAYLWWTLRCAFRQCLFGVSGSSVKFYAILILAESVVIPANFLIRTEGFVLLTPEGKVSDGVIIAAAAAMLLISSVVVLVSARRRGKETSSE